MEIKLEKNWDLVKEKLKEHQLSLTDDDLVLIPGKEEEMLEGLQKKLNMSREELIEWIESASANK